MVQITNTFVAVTAAAAVVAPAFAAPVVEAREPRFKEIAKIGGRIASGASLGMTVAPLLQHQQREVQDLEARRITSAQAKVIAHEVGKAAHSAKSGIEFGAAVAPLVLPHKQRRSVEYDLLPRKFHVSSSTLKKGGKFAAGAAGFAGAVAAANAQQRRDFDESQIEAREPSDLLPRKFHISSGTLKKGGRLAAGAAGFGGAVAAANAQQRRELDDSELEARDPKFNFGSIFKTVGKFIREDDEELMARDYEDEDLYAREFDDIETREPKFRIGSILKTVGNFIREDEADELLAREPLFLGAIFKGVGKVAKNFIRETEGLDELD